MITFLNNSENEPFKYFRSKYEYALSKKQRVIQAASISSFSNKKNEVDARFVNIKFLDSEEFIFFTNYKSPKSEDFLSHDQIAVSIFWNKIDFQVRMKAKIDKKDKEYNQEYFLNRSPEKNALAISSKQSNEIKNYQAVVDNYKKVFKNHDLKKCPDYWGGFSFKPYVFEFWEGHENRLNKRLKYELVNDSWNKSILQP